ncbi:putative metallocarboxypeptidase ECM14 [Phyllosticta citribraziliensis]
MRATTYAALALAVNSLALASPQHYDRYSYSPSEPRDARPPWRKLSDFVIQSLWRTSEPLNTGTPSKPSKGRVAPPPKVLARYGDDMVLRFNLTTEYEARKLADASATLFLDVWEFNDNWVDIRVAKDVVPSLLGLLPPSLQDAHAPLMRDHDLAQAIFDSYPATDPSAIPSREPFSHEVRSTQNAQTNLFFRDYQPLSVITPWMKLMESLFTTHVRLINVGITYEGRDIPALRVGVHPNNKDTASNAAPRKTILVSGGIHAREWISTTTVNYLAYSLITSYGKSSLTTALLEAYDWIFIPTLNPDGYVYTWETDRLWRKNRQPTSLRFCRGIDLDRSYPFHWDADATRGNPCSESYAGETPFEGVESKRFAEWARNQTSDNNVEFVAFLDLHSYSQQVLYPYSYSCDATPPTLENLEEVGMGLAKAIRISKTGHVYKSESACRGNVVAATTPNGAPTVLPRIETGGGAALDYFYHELGVRYSYQIKLRDTGSYGFLLPKEHIVPTGKEILDAVLYLGRFFLGELGLQSDDGESAATPPPQKEGIAQTGPTLAKVSTIEELDVEGPLDWGFESRTEDREDDSDNDDVDDDDDDDRKEEEDDVDATGAWELRRRRRR